MGVIRWAANLSMLFTEVSLLERFELAARAGFRHVEFLFPYSEDVDAIAATLRRLGMELVLFNLPAGNWAAGERGIANNPARREEFRQGVEQAVDIARRLGVTRINCLVGLRQPGVSDAEQHACLVDNLRLAADRLGQAGITLMVEPINDTDMPGFSLTTSRQALALLDEVGRPNARVQYDVYHMQVMEGNLVATLRKHIGRIGHVQVADVPGRHEPGTGEINYPFVLSALAAAGYDGFVSLEYKPSGTTEQSLARAAQVLQGLGFPVPAR